MIVKERTMESRFEDLTVARIVEAIHREYASMQIADLVQSNARITRPNPTATAIFNSKTPNICRMIEFTIRSL
jgi:hypothetical protein